MQQPRAERDYWQQVEELFHEALALPAAARAAFLRENCNGNAEMEQDTQEILESYEAQEDAISQTAAALGGGMRCGAFELLSKLGEGGMGTVYLARRCGDFEQHAAVKLMNGTPASIALLAERFRQERQILAALEHPNIARVLDGGIAANGQPYLAMEYVNGVRLDRYCEEGKLSLDQRLELFRSICAAVQFAHSHLVVHRDLKPANILVDEHGEPKLLDFGIAKILDADDGPEKEAATLTGGLLMTPEFASPEQLQGKPCTVASDIYSLGVILYQLLTGNRPYGKESSTPAEMLAAVVTREPVRPSLMAPEELRIGLRGDLDGIVLKALAKKPEDRYSSVEQFAEDLRRHMAGLPVSAVEGTRAYIARKFIGRHKVAVAATAFVMLSLVAGIGGTLWQARRAEQQRVLAEQHFSDARKLANYLLFPLFDSVTPLPGSLPVRADMADQSLQYLDRLAAAKSNDPALQLELAEGYLRLGTILIAPSGSGDSLGNPSRALESDRKALALLDPLEKEEPGSERIRRDLARSYLLTGTAQNQLGQVRDGVASITRAVSLFDQLAASNPRDAESQLESGQAWQTLMDVAASPAGGFMDYSTKDTVAADGDRAIARFECALEISPSDNAALLGISRVYTTEGGVQMNPVQGLALFQKGIDAFHRLPASVQSSPEGLIEEARLDTAVALAQQRMGKNKEALIPLGRAREILDGFAAADPKNSTNALRRANVYKTLGAIYYNLNQKQKTVEAYRTAIQILTGLIAVDPSRTSTRLVRAVLEEYTAVILADLGRLSEATPYAKSAIAELRNLADRPDAALQYLDEAAIALMTTPVQSLRDDPRALRYAQRADEISQGKDIITIGYLAHAYANVGDGQKALETVQRALALVPAPPGQAPSKARKNLEHELEGIRTLIRTGHLPAGFNSDH